MKPEPQREEALFQAASQLTGPARSAFLAQACADNAALRARLEALLAAHEASAGVLADEPAADSRALLRYFVWVSNKEMLNCRTS